MNILIFSAWRDVLGIQENRRNVAALKQDLKAADVQYTVAQGCYKGATEPALVVTDTPHARRIVQGLCRHLNQESILAVDADRHAQLETCYGNLIEALGVFRNVPEGAARSCDAWTRIGTDFYTTELFGSKTP